METRRSGVDRRSGRSGRSRARRAAPEPPGPRRRPAERAAFVLASSTVVVVTSEKFYWYPHGFPSPADLELVAAYALAVLAFFVVVQRHVVRGPAGCVVAAAAFALVVEGSITPVLYEDGPLPVLAVYFLGWHGLLAVVFGWYTIRRLAITRRAGVLAGASAAYGAVVGLWSTTYWHPDRISEMEADAEVAWAAGQWPVDRFATYSLLMSATLMVGHWVMDRCWPVGWRIGRAGSTATAALVASGVGLWTFAVPYAPVKFVVLALGLRWLLLRGDRRSDGSVDTIFEELTGRVPFARLVPVLLIAPAATAVYAVMAAIEPAPSTLDAVYWSMVVTTVAAGGAGLLAAARSRGRRTTTSRRAIGHAGASGVTANDDGEPLVVQLVTDAEP